MSPFGCSFTKHLLSTCASARPSIIGGPRAAQTNETASMACKRSSWSGGRRTSHHKIITLHVKCWTRVLRRSVGTEGRERDSAVSREPTPLPCHLFALGQGCCHQDQASELLPLNWITVYKFIQHAFIKCLLRSLHRELLRRKCVSGQDRWERSTSENLTWKEVRVHLASLAYQEE